MNQLNEQPLIKKFNNFINKIETNDNKKNITKKGKSIANQLRAHLQKKSKNYFLIKINKKKDKDIRDKTIYISKLFGTHLGQDKDKNKILEIKPNLSILKKTKGNLSKNIRYHQTNKGGSIHTDGPQLNECPSILIMGCINNAAKGGDSILVDAKRIYLKIKKKNKKYVNELSKKFYFERRGFNFKKKYIKKPIFEKKNNKIYFRYLREYIISGYRKAKKEIDQNKLEAMNYLDKTMNIKKNQKKIKMKKGDLIIINNKITAHGRTEFPISAKNQRKLIRSWIK